MHAIIKLIGVPVDGVRAVHKFVDSEMVKTTPNQVYTSDANNARQTDYFMTVLSSKLTGYGKYTMEVIFYPKTWSDWERKCLVLAPRGLLEKMFREIDSSLFPSSDYCGNAVNDDGR